ncbi:MAG: metallophosphoesterase [Caldilinea sp.]
MSDSSTTMIGIVTDTHYWARSQPIRTSDGAVQLQPWSEQILTTLLAEMQAAQVDLVVHLGDLVCGGGSYGMPGDEFEDAMNYVHRRLHETGAPVMALPGNHDAHPGSGDLRKFHTLWQYEAGIGKTIDLPQARLILLNAMGHTPGEVAAAPDCDPVYGVVSTDELDRLDEALSTADGRPVLIFTHQLLVRWTGSRDWRGFYGILNAAQVMAVIERHGGVRAIMQGHAHRLDIQTLTLDQGQRCMVGILPGTIEFPVAWMNLSLGATQGRVQLQRLPLPEVSAISEQSGSGQTWRGGDPSWWDYRFPLY